MRELASAAILPRTAGPPETVHTPGPAASFHVLDGEALLFDARGQRLYALDRAAAFIWCCLADGLGVGAARARLAAAADIDPQTAGAWIADAIASWKRLGLLGVADLAARGAGRAHERIRAPVARPRVPAPRGSYTDLTVSVAGVAARLSVARSVAWRVLAPFAHLAGAEDGPTVRMEIREAGAGYLVFADGEPVAEVGDIAGLAPALKALLAQIVLVRADYRLAVHAAAVAREGRVLLLPAVAGSGKTTLAAALMASGFSLLGDDTVLLQGEALQVRPVPFALAVKSGAWDLLARYHPSLTARAVDQRPDGQRVRYLPPASVAPGALPARWIVFPSRAQGGPARLAPMPRVAALRQFLGLCYAPAQRLGPAEIAALVAWIARVDTLALNTGDLGDAVAQLDRLCG